MTKAMNDIGVIYYATGEKYLNEAEFSCRSLKRHSSFPVALITDDASYQNPLFDDVIVFDPAGFHPYQNKVRILQKSPFEKSIFIDTDTMVIKSINKLSRILEEYDFYITPCPHVDWSEKPVKFIGFRHPSHFQTGFFGFKKNAATMSFLKLWEEEVLKLDLYDPACKLTDQDVFNSATLQDEFRRMKYTTLNNLEWNTTETILLEAQKKGYFLKHRVFHFHWVKKFNYRQYIFHGVKLRIKDLLGIGKG